MKKIKNDRLEPITVVSKSEASTNAHTLDLLSKILAEMRQNNALIKESLGKTSKSPMGVTLTSKFKGANSNLPLKVTSE
jgi:hypothetical protein